MGDEYVEAFLLGGGFVERDFCGVGDWLFAHCEAGDQLNCNSEVW
jgi:hypothetical protein